MGCWYCPHYLYIAGIVLLIVLIILGIKAIKILDSAQEVVDDIQEKVDSFDGLLVDYMKKTKANVCIRGLRAVTDLDYEFTLASINKKLSPKMETIFLMPSEKNTYLSSSVVKEVYKFGGELKGSVPTNIDKALKKKFKK